MFFPDAPFPSVTHSQPAIRHSSSSLQEEVCISSLQLCCRSHHTHPSGSHLGRLNSFTPAPVSFVGTWDSFGFPLSLPWVNPAGDILTRQMARGRVPAQRAAAQGQCASHRLHYDYARAAARLFRAGQNWLKQADTGTVLRESGRLCEQAGLTGFVPR